MIDWRARRNGHTVERCEGTPRAGAPSTNFSDGGRKERKGTVIGERGAIHAFLMAEPTSRGPLEVEVRELPPTTDPRSGRLVAVPPLVVLWIEDRPLAARLRGVVAINRFPPEPRLATALEADCVAAGLAIERLCEAAIWRLFSQPPRPRLAR
jgi:hypothetical protein